MAGLLLLTSQVLREYPWQAGVLLGILLALTGAGLLWGDREIRL
jgi:hypothetical protein